MEKKGEDFTGPLNDGVIDFEPETQEKKNKCKKDKARMLQSDTTDPDSTATGTGDCELNDTHADRSGKGKTRSGFDGMKDNNKEKVEEGVKVATDKLKSYTG
jgi:hypothetical protein